MKILVITKDTPGTNLENKTDLLADEAIYVYKLQQDGIMREIYFTEKKDAILILECKSLEHAEQIINDLPLVKAGLISFQLNELNPYSGFNRLLNKSE